MTIKVLGTGCPNCKRLEAHTREALKRLNLEADVEKVEDLPSIMSYGVMSTPALVIDEQVVLYGRVPSVRDLKALLQARN